MDPDIDGGLRKPLTESPAKGAFLKRTFVMIQDAAVKNYRLRVIAQCG